MSRDIKFGARVDVSEPFRLDFPALPLSVLCIQLDRIEFRNTVREIDAYDISGIAAELAAVSDDQLHLKACADVLKYGHVHRIGARHLVILIPDDLPVFVFVIGPDKTIRSRKVVVVSVLILQVVHDS